MFFFFFFFLHHGSINFHGKPQVEWRADQLRWQSSVSEPLVSQTWGTFNMTLFLLAWILSHSAVVIKNTTSSSAHLVFFFLTVDTMTLSWAFFLYIINIISGTSVTPNNTELLLIIMFTFMIKISQSPVQINLQQLWNHDILQRADDFSLRVCWLWIYLLCIILILPPEVDQNLNKIAPPLRIWDFHTVELFSAQKQVGYKCK